MAYSCPRCGRSVHRAHSAGAQFAAGLVGALFYAAFGGFQCPRCGRIPTAEFPEPERGKMLLGTTWLVLGAVLLAVVVIALMKSR